MIKQFVKDSAVYGLTTILARGISFLLLPFYTRVLTPEDYGVIDILTVFAALVCLIAPLEISQALAIFYSDAQGETEKMRVASTALWFTTGAYVLFALVGLIFSRPLTALMLDAPQRLTIFQVALLATSLQGFFYLLQGQLRWMLLPRGYAITSLLTTLISILLTIVLVLALRLGVLGVLLGQICGNLTGSCMAFYFGRRSYALQFDWARLVEMLRFSIPLVPASISVFVMLYVDRIMIKSLLTLADVGVFGVAYRITSIVSLLMIAFRGALTPLIYNNYRKPETPAEIAQIFRYFCAFGLLTFVALSLFSREIILIFAPAEYEAAAGIIPFMAPAAMLVDMYIFAPGLTLAKKTRIIAVINILGALVTTALNFSLIPLMGVRGAAFANLLSNALIFALNMRFSQKHYPVPHAWRQLGLAAFLCVAIVFLTTVQLPLGLFASIALKALLLCCSAAGLFLSKLVKIGEIGRLYSLIFEKRISAE